MIELTDEQIRDILRSIDTGLYDGIRAVIAAALAQQSARHAEELAAYEVTVGNLRTQREQAQPVPCPDNPAWHYERLDRLLSMTLSAESYEDYLYSLNIVAAPQAQPGHKPMTDGEKLYAMWHSSDANDLDDFLDGWRHAEAFHGIKEKP